MDDKEPRCCGEPMQTDEYLFVCATNPQVCPTVWVTIDDETWK